MYRYDWVCDRGGGRRTVDAGERSTHHRAGPFLARATRNRRRRSGALQLRTLQVPVGGGLAEAAEL